MGSAGGLVGFEARALGALAPQPTSNRHPLVEVLGGLVSRLGRWAPSHLNQRRSRTRWLRCERSEPRNQPTADPSVGSRCRARAGSSASRFVVGKSAGYDGGGLPPRLSCRVRVCRYPCLVCLRNFARFLLAPRELQRS